MTRHFVLTRSAYGPDWDTDANRRRLAITRGVTARLMAQQTWRDWTWVVLLDRRDPLLAERIATFALGAPHLVPVLWEPDDLAAAPWDRNGHRTNARQKVAATAYRAPWPVGDRRRPTLMTRIDDDDGFTPDALERTVRLARKIRRRTALVQPIGYRVWQGRCAFVEHDTNAMHSLLTPPGDDLVIYDYGHRLVRQTVRTLNVDQRPAWLWVRHPDSISGHRRADGPITPAVRALFPIDWSLV